MQTSQWQPQEGVTNHAGNPIATDADFFAPPLPEIGTVLSADTTLRASQEPMPLGLQILSILLGTLVCGGIAYVLITALIADRDAWVLFFIFLAAVIPGFVIYSKVRFAHRCSYVGEFGIAEFKISGSRDSKTKMELLEFISAKELFTSQTRNYYNGIYTGTDYNYRWEKRDGSKFHLIGHYHSKKDCPKDSDRWHFARAAEAAWSHYCLQALNTQVEELGYVEFAMTGNPKAVRVGSGFLEFVTKNGESQRVEVADMKNISLDQGLFHFGHKDARWWSGKGKYSFAWAKLPNAKLFLLCLDSLAGIRWT